MTGSGNLATDLNDDLVDFAKGVWWWVLIRGILAIAFGVIALLTPGQALLAIAIVFGAFALVDGIVAVVHAVQVRSSYKYWGWLIVQGVLSALAGLAALILPGLAGAFGGLVVLWTIVIWNIAHGAAGIRSAAGAAQGSGRTWGIVAGVFNVLFGIVLALLVLFLPGAAILGLVWAIGIAALVFGLMLVIAAIQVRTSLPKKSTPSTSATA
jgi:uncharacterized membrane protein HdeD (DUF308 family)